MSILSLLSKFRNPGMKFLCISRLTAAIVSVHMIYAACPRDGTPVQDTCGSTYSGYGFYLESTGRSDQCTCTLRTGGAQDNARVTLYRRSDVTQATCQSYSFVAQGFSDGQSFAWCDAQGTVTGTMTTDTIVTFDVTKSVTFPSTDPDHCLLVSTFVVINVTCGSDGQPVTRPRTTTIPTTNPTSTTIPTSTAAPTTVTTSAEKITSTGTSPNTVTSSASTEAVSVTEPAGGTEPVQNGTSKPMTERATTTPVPVVGLGTESAIVIGASIGAVILIILIIVVVLRVCCRSEDRSEKYLQEVPPKVNPTAEDVSQPKQVVSESYTNHGYTVDVPVVNTTKQAVVKSFSSPPANTSPLHAIPIANGTSMTVSGVVHADGTAFRNTADDFRQHQLETFHQGLKNTEMVNNGDTIEANHKYISKVVLSHSNGYYSYPNSRSNSVKRSDDTRRNTERLQDGSTIEAEHKYVTRIGLPVVSGYYSHPRSRAGSFRSPVQLILSPEEALRRKESWYRNESLVRQKGPLAQSRSKSNSVHLGAL